MISYTRNYEKKNNIIIKNNCVVDILVIRKLMNLNLLTCFNCLIISYGKLEKKIK